MQQEPDIGHNSSRFYTSARAEALDAISPYQERLEEILKALRSINISNRGDASLAIDRIGIAKGFSEIILTKRDETRLGYVQAKEVTDACFYNFIQPLLTEIEAATEKLTQYQAEFKRQEAERKKAVSVAIPEVGTAPVKPQMLRGDYGKKLVTRTRRIAVLEDISKVPEWVMNTKAVQEALEKVATKMLDQHEAIPGFTISTVEKANVQ